MVVQVSSPVQLLFVDRLLKGDTGAAGLAGSTDLTEHLSTYNHGDIHTHTNKGVLDSLSVVDTDLCVNGTSVVDSVVNSSEFSAFEQDIDTQIDAMAEDLVLSAANEYLYTSIYGFAGWVSSNRPTEAAIMANAGWVAAVEDLGGS